MTVGITDKYIQQIQDLLNLWDPNCRLFKVDDMQQLIGKLARLHSSQNGVILSAILIKIAPELKMF